MKKPDDSRALGQVLVVQILALGVAGACAAALGLGDAKTTLLGGVVAFVPNLWMARRVTRSANHERPLVAAGVLFGAMLFKLVLAVGLLALALSQLPSGQGPAFFMGFLVVHAAHRIGAWIAPL
jgi:F0F1-type ATP synthase assembly protein I